MLVPHNGWWDRQPTSSPRIRSDMVGLGLVHALLPGFDNALYVIDYARPNATPPSNTGYRGNSVMRAVSQGVAMQMHPFSPNETGDTPSNNAVKTLRFPVLIGPNDSLTVIWCGYINTPGNGGNDGYGALWALGADGNGNGWGARHLAIGTGNLAAYYIDSSPAQYTTNLSVSGGISSGQYLAAGYRKRGGSGEVTSFSGATEQQASSNQGNGSMRTSTVGFDLAGSGQNPASNNGVPGGTVTGHNQPLVALVFKSYLPDDLIYSLLNNPYQAWANESSVIWVPMEAGGTPPPAYAGIRRGYGLGGNKYDLANAQRGYAADGSKRILVPVARGYSVGGTKYTIT